MADPPGLARVLCFRHRGQDAASCACNVPAVVAEQLAFDVHVEEALAIANPAPGRRP